MNAKITFFFEGVQAANRYASASLGWTETFYGSGAPATVDAWLTAPDVIAYIQLRRQTLPRIYRIAWLRVSDEANPRNFKIMAINSATGVALTPGITTQSQVVANSYGQVQCALLVDLVHLQDNPTDHTHHRKFLMRALPADVIQGNVLNADAPNWPTIVNFLNWLANHESGAAVIPPGSTFGGFALNSTLGLKYQNPALNTWNALGAVTPVAGDPRSIDVAGNLGPLAGRVRIRRAPDANRFLNRVWSIAALTGGPPPTATILGRAKKDITFDAYTPPGPAQWQLASPLYHIFEQYTIIGLRNKKTGKLFRQLRGRSSAR